jgi:hypothetical protein
LSSFLIALSVAEPFCSNRTGCSNHGDCDCQNSICHCACDPNFSGDRCEVTTCNVTCFHGGVCNQARTACDCPAGGGWTGADCSTWNASSLPSGALAARLQKLKNASLERLQSQIAKYGTTICKSGQECVGWGVDATTGTLGIGTSMLELAYEDHTSWHDLIFPKGVQVDGSSAPSFEADTQAFLSLDDYNSFKYSLLGDNKGRAAGYTEPADVMNTHYFDNAADVSLSITQYTYALYNMKIVPDGTSPSQTMLKIDGNVLKAVSGLGPYAEDKDNWHDFFGWWGTDVVSSARGGGILELRDLPKTVLQETYSHSLLENNAACSGQKGTRIGPSCEIDPIYRQYLDWQWASCYGGIPTTCERPTGGKGGFGFNSSTLNAWVAGLTQLPRLVDYSFTPLSPFIADQHVQSIFDHAVQAYVAEKRAADPKTGCPPTCNGRGKCTKGSRRCACTNINPNEGGSVCWLGRQCDTYKYADKFKYQTRNYRGLGAGIDGVFKRYDYDQCAMRLKDDLPGGLFYYKNEDKHGCQVGCLVNQKGAVCGSDGNSHCTEPYAAVPPTSSGTSHGTSCHHEGVVCSVDTTYN